MDAHDTPLWMISTMDSGELRWQLSYGRYSHIFREAIENEYEHRLCMGLIGELENPSDAGLEKRKCAAEYVKAFLIKRFRSRNEKLEEKWPPTIQML